MRAGLILVTATLLASVILVSGCIQYGGQQAEGADGAGEQQAPLPGAQAGGTGGNTVEITASGFSPGSLTINAGETVSFVNRDSKPHWPASAVHPTHTAYPEPGGCIGSKFDACHSLAEGEAFSFAFGQKGEWKYHDHLNPSMTGTIIVQ